MATAKERAKQEAADRLLSDTEGFGLTPGETVYCVLRHKSSSGMFRIIDLFVLRDGQPRYIARDVADLIDYRYDDERDGLKVSGAGMDMGFHVVNSLSSALFSGYGVTHGYNCLGERCPSNAHVNDYRSPRGEGVRHTDSYALSSRWL